MGPFLLSLVTVSILIVIGVFVSLYLYRQGAIRYRRWRRAPQAEGYTIDTQIDTGGLGEDMLDPTARYARGGVVVAIACLLVMVMLLAAVVNAGLH